jgi:hypothetical protein
LSGAARSFDEAARERSQGSLVPAAGLEPAQPCGPKDFKKIELEKKYKPKGARAMCNLVGLAEN